MVDGSAGLLIKHTFTRRLRYAQNAFDLLGMRALT
jgi:hypothetical protein